MILLQFQYKSNQISTGTGTKKPETFPVTKIKKKDGKGRESGTTKFKKKIGSGREPGTESFKESGTVGYLTSVPVDL